MSEPVCTGAWWARPQVLISALAVLAAASFALRAGPPAVEPPPDLVSEPVDAQPTRRREVVVYLVSDGVARPVVRQVADLTDPSASLQAVVDSLIEVLVEGGAWPAEVAPPEVFVLEVERERAAVLDLRGGRPRLDVDGERTVLASFERTLLEESIERVAYLVEGEPVESWLGSLGTDASLE